MTAVKLFAIARQRLIIVALLQHQHLMKLHLEKLRVWHNLSLSKESTRRAPPTKAVQI